MPSPSTQQPITQPIYAKQVGDDPHLFLDPGLISVYPETVADSMVIKDGVNQAYYNARYQAYRAQLEAMNADIQQKMAGIPADNRGDLVTYHNSLIWFAKRYGLSVAGTLTDNGETALAQVVANTHAPALFTETGYDTSVLERIADGARIRVCNLDTDTVQDESVTYIEMMEENASTIADCLG